MDKSAKKTLRVVLTIALVILALNVLFWVLLLVSCKSDADRRAADEARLQELLGEAPAAVSLSASGLAELRSGFDYIPLLEEAAEEAVCALNAPAVQRDLRLYGEGYLLEGSSLYLSARYYSSEAGYALVLRADLGARTAEAVYAAEGEDWIDLLSAEENALFWFDGDEAGGAAVLYDAAAKRELARTEGELHAAGEFVWQYVFTPGTAHRESVRFFGQEGGELASYTYPLEGDTAFLTSPRGVVRGVAYAEADGQTLGICVRTGELLDAQRCARHLACAPFAYGWEKGAGEDVLYRGGEELVIDSAWVSARSGRAAELLELERASFGGVSAELLADGTPCIRFEVGYRSGWWGEEKYSLLFRWTEEDTLEYLGCPQLSGRYGGGIVCRAEEV